MQKILDYAQLDVFAERALEGNMLAVFADGRGLSSEEMQAIARETNLSETTFILPRDAATERERGVHVRIFTVQEELPFAGHPTLGTASWLYFNHPEWKGAETIMLDLAGGRIPVSFIADDGPGVYGEMLQNDPVFGSVHDRKAVAEALGLAEDDLHPTRPVQTVSTGKAFCIVPVRTLEAMKRLQIPQAKASRYLAQSDATMFFCITEATKGSGADWHARMQFYNGEDPATGSASGCAIAYLVRYGLVAPEQAVILEQGIEIKRPSRIYLCASQSASKNPPGFGVHKVRVGGRTIPVASGQLFLP